MVILVILVRTIVEDSDRRKAWNVWVLALVLSSNSSHQSNAEDEWIGNAENWSLS